MHPEADPEVRNPTLTGDTTGEDLPFPAARSEAAGDEHAVDALELGLGLFERHALGVDPADADAAAVMDARVLQRLVNREIRVVELHVLADEADVDLAAALRDALGQLGPLAELGRLRREPELLADHLVEALGLELLRDEVDVRHVAVQDDGLRLEVGEHRDLVAQVGRELVLRAADDDVRVDPDAA